MFISWRMLHALDRICFFCIGGFILIALTSSCVDQHIKLLEPFYYPEKDQVFVFSSNDSIGKEYWALNTADDEKYEITIHDGHFNAMQTIVEKKYNNGVNLEYLIVDSVIAEVKSGFIFPFDEIDNTEVLFYHVSWTENKGQNPIRYEIIRNRRFDGYETKSVMGDSISCVVLSLDERIISDVDGSIELSTTGKEYYGRDIGLVYRIKNVNPEITIEQELLDIMSPAEFDRLRMTRDLR